MVRAIPYGAGCAPTFAFMENAKALISHTHAARTAAYLPTFAFVENAKALIPQ